MDYHEKDDPTKKGTHSTTGHTFCQACTSNHMDRHKKTTCPVCRKKIDSKVRVIPMGGGFQGVCGFNKLIDN
eukprot:91079-Pelagomonas_calceolata.AAC.7